MKAPVSLEKDEEKLDLTPGRRIEGRLSLSLSRDMCAASSWAPVTGAKELSSVLFSVQQM